MDLFNFLKKHRSQAVLGVVGLTFIVIGVIQMMDLSKGDEVEVVSHVESGDRAGIGIVVDVAGAVEKPGVYRLEPGIRIADALVAAGGLAVDADRSWVARFVNQAEVVKDGAKIYIPFQGEGSGDKKLDDSGGGELVAGAQVVNINTASISQLDTLWGVGEKRAQTIIDNRPYSSIEELITKANLSQDIIDKNSGKISVY